MFLELTVPCISLGQAGLSHVRLTFVVPTEFTCAFSDAC